MDKHASFISFETAAAVGKMHGNSFVFFFNGMFSFYPKPQTVTDTNVDMFIFKHFIRVIKQLTLLQQI